MNILNIKNIWYGTKDIHINVYDIIYNIIKSNIYDINITNTTFNNDPCPYIEKTLCIEYYDGKIEYFNENQQITFTNINKKKILLIGFYGYSDGYYALGNELEKYYDIKFFPLFAWRDKCIHSNYKKNDLELEINNYNPDMLLVWHNFDFIDHFVIDEIHFNLKKYLQNIKNIKKINLNWDLGYNYIVMKDTIEIFDIIFGVSIKHNTFSNYKFFNQGYNEKLSYKSEHDLKYKCDISFIGTNLYENYGNNKNCTRKQILDIITNDKTINCHIYGSENIKNMYPKHYKNYISYNNCHKVFSNSLLNLNISPINDDKNNNHYYYSERLAQIFGCEGLMVCNNDFGNFIPKNCYIKINKPEEIISIINLIKNNKDIYDEYIKNIKLIKEKFNYKNIVNEQMKKHIDNI